MLAHRILLTAMVGCGTTLMLKFCTVPGQVFNNGVTLTFANKVDAPELVLIKLMSPVPLAPRPTLVLEFVQLNTAPAVPAKLTTTGTPGQTLGLAGALTLGVGLTVRVKF